MLKVRWKKKGSPRRRKRTFSSLLPSRQRLMVYCLSTQLPRVSLGSQRNEYTDVSFRDISQEKRTKFPVCSRVVTRIYRPSVDSMREEGRGGKKKKKEKK